MLFFASKLTKQIHADVIALYEAAPHFSRLHCHSEAGYFGGDVLYIADPTIDLDLEWDDDHGFDTLAPHFQHYPTGVKVWMGDKPSRTRHSKITEEGWAGIIGECHRIIETYKRHAAA